MTYERRRRQVYARTLGLCALAVVVVACGEIDGSSSANGGVIPISQSGTYGYTVNITPPPPPLCVSSHAGGIQLPCVGSPDCSGVTLTLTSDGTADMLNTSGSLYFAAGNWTGTLSDGGASGCTWTLTLTPS